MTEINRVPVAFAASLERSRQLRRQRRIYGRQGSYPSPPSRSGSQIQAAELLTVPRLVHRGGSMHVDAKCAFRAFRARDHAETLTGPMGRKA